jgi:hypothetical protein
MGETFAQQGSNDQARKTHRKGTEEKKRKEK